MLEAARKPRMMAGNSALTKEVYLDLKKRGLSDENIGARLSVNVSRVNKLKKEWGLKGQSRQVLQGIQADEPEPTTPVRPAKRTQEECFANPVLQVDIQSGELLVNRLWSWLD